MKHFLPPQHRARYSTRSVSRGSLQVRVPKQFPWKMLNELVKSFRQDLPEEDFKFIDGVVRRRDLEALSLIESEWGPQRLVSTGISLREFTAKYQLSATLKKYPFPGSEDLCKANALDKFHKAEALCGAFNTEGYKKMLYMNDRDPELSGFLNIARDFIIKVVGSQHDLPVILQNGRHGPGSSLCTVKGRVTPYYKWSDLPYTVTQTSRSLAISTIESDPRWIGALDDWYRRTEKIPFNAPISREQLFEKVLKVENGNRITFVPKTRKTHRTIAIEPRMNLFIQLGVDHFIRNRLKRFGCDLDSQVKNQILAHEGSVSGRYATLDLSMASDTISTKIVELLFPPDWVNLLYDLRAPEGVVGLSDEKVSYQKLSSMGNGFTFAIESLIFLSLSYAALTCHNRRTKGEQFSLHNDIAVFGDDIVIPTLMAKDVELMLRWSGFRLNVDKSFTSGPFRESCGKDYFSGTLVRPLQLKKEVKDVIELYSIHNRCMYWDSQRDAEDIFGVRFEALKNLVYNLIPRRFRLITGPPNTEEFDTYIHTPITKAQPKWKRGLYSHFRLVEIATTGFKANQFFFRKLMALNKPSHERNRQFSRVIPTLQGLLGRGNVFAVTQRNSTGYKLVESRTSFWFDYYYLS